MAADFDAGSIEGTLDLNAKPFAEGLRKARQDAQRFEDDTVEAKAGLDTTEFDDQRQKLYTELDELSAKQADPNVELDDAEFTAKRDEIAAALDELDQRQTAAQADLDTTEFTLKKEKVEAELDELGTEDAKPEVELQGVTKTLLGISLIKRALHSLSGGSMFGGVSAGAGFTQVGQDAEEAAGGLSMFASSGYGTLALIALLIPALGLLGPALAVVGGYAAAAGLAIAGIIPGVALFGILASTTIAKVAKLQEQGGLIPKALRPIAHGLTEVKDAWEKLSKQPVVVDVLAKALQVVADLLPKLEPLIQGAARGLGALLDAFDGFIHTKGFSAFTRQLGEFTEGFIKGAVPIIGSLLVTFRNLFIALSPLMTQLGHGLSIAFGALAQWSKGAAHGGLVGFIDYVNKYTPKLLQLLGALGQAVVDLFQAFAPMSDDAFQIFTLLAHAISLLADNAGPLFAVVGAILKVIAAEVVLTAMGVKFLLGVLGPFLTMLAQVERYVADTLLGMTGLSHAVRDAAIWVAAFATKVGQAVLPVLRQFWAILKANLKPALDAIIAVWKGDLLPALQNAWQRLKPLAPVALQFAQALGKLWQAVKPVVTAIGALGVILLKLVGVFLQHVLPVLIKVVGYILGKVITTLVSLVTTFVTMQLKIATVVAKLLTAVINAFTRIVDGIRTAGSKIIDAVTTAWSKASSATTSAIDHIKSWVSNGFDAVRDTVENILSDVAGWISRKLDDIVGGFRSLVGKLRSAGSDAINAFKDGILAPLKDISGWVKDHIVDPLINAIKDHFGIGSPSKVMAELGGHLLSGFVKGLSSGDMLDIAKKVFGDLPSALEHVVSSGAIKLGSIPLKLLGKLGFLGGGNALENLTGSPGQNQALGRQLAAQIGWTGSMWNALNALVMSESGWNATAQNPTSTAYGIGQFLDSTWASVGAVKTSIPLLQIQAMFRYIMQRYGNPLGAWAFKQSHGWYGAGLQGGVFDKPTLIGVGERGPEEVSITPRNRPGAGMSLQAMSNAESLRLLRELLASQKETNAKLEAQLAKLGDLAKLPDAQIRKLITMARAH